ncbi:MAG: hypothetical protein HY425_01990 [Candidatus Levybacteria bacterium]|nr:hypothetical protein [Candidatus Levybacteria bacterium]
MEGSGFQEAPRDTGENNLGQRFAQAIKKEALKDFPKISIDILYARHETREDLAGFRERLKESDIYIPESSGWRKETLRRFNDLSFGGIRALRNPTDMILGFSRNGGFFAEQIRAIRNSLKPITIIDLPAGHPIMKEYNKTLNSIVYRGGFSDMFNAFKENFRRFAELNKEREDYMISHLFPAIQEVLERFPNLKKKKELKILMTLGSLHTAVGQNFQQSGLDTKREFNRRPYLFDFQNEVRRRYSFDKEVSDQLAAKALLDSWFWKELSNKYPSRKDKDGGEKIAFVRKIIDAFDIKDVEEIYNAALMVKGKNKKRRRSNELFFTKLDQKGIILPKTEQELDEFLAKPLPRPNPQTQKQ